MKKQIGYVRIIVIFILGVLLSGCHEDDLIGDKLMPIKMEFEGLKIKASKDKIYLSSQIVSEGIFFRTYVKEIIRDIGYLSYISVQNGDGEILDEVDFKPRIYEPDFKPQMSYESEYISMQYLTEEPPYEIAYEIKENHSTQSRIITIEYGDKDVFKYTKLTITQAGK